MAPEGGLDTVSVFRGAGFGMVVAAALLVLATVALYLVQQPSVTMPMAAVLIAWLSVLASGFSAARRAGRAGLWNGAVAGLVLFIALYLVGVLGFDHPVQMLPFALRAAASLCVGALGGIVGVAL